MNTSHEFPTSHYVESNGLRLHHLDWGTADQHPLVLLHGIRLHAYCFGEFARRNRQKYHLLTLDARGHGDSEWAKKEDYHLHDYYEDLAAIMDARALEPVTLIGHSLGARISMLYSHLHPERVRRLVLVDMGAGLPDFSGKRDFSRVTETPPPQDFASHQEAIDYLGGILKLAPKDMIEESVVHGMREMANARYTWKYDPALGGPPQPQPNKREWDMWEVVRNIPCPTLLLRGEHSQVVPQEIAERMGREMPDCRVETVSNAGHALFTDQPAVFHERVTEFLESTGG